MKIYCKTLFDITATGVTGHHKLSQIPFKDRAGKMVIDIASWTRSRNQQRNWETLMQILQMRTQIYEVKDPVFENNEWTFSFEVDNSLVYGNEENAFDVLESDCQGVPMLLGLEEIKDLDPVLITQGPGQNIWFVLED